MAAANKQRVLSSVRFKAVAALQMQLSRRRKPAESQGRRCGYSGNTLSMQRCVARSVGEMCLVGRVVDKGCASRRDRPLLLLTSDVRNESGNSPTTVPQFNWKTSLFL